MRTMLTLLEIEPFEHGSYRVSLERDGSLLKYEFTCDLDPDGVVAGVSEPNAMYLDLLDYEAPPRGPSRGTFDIPAIRRVRRLVYRFAIGERVELPEVLDPR